MISDNAKHNILIVDDEPANIKVLMPVLMQEGYEVRTALEGRLAIASAVERIPDLILLDVRMPEMDGFEVCRQLKDDERLVLVPIIFISALGETKDIVRGLKLGGADYIIKPFRIEEVLARIKAHLSIRALQKQLKERNDQLRHEIEDRKLAEKALRELNEHLEQRVEERTTRLQAQTFELLDAKEAAEAASIAKSKFLSKMSHELRTPLNPIMGYAQILKLQPNLTKEQKEQLQVVCDSCQHLTELISNMLDLADIDTLNETVEDTEFNLLALIRKIVGDMNKKARKKGFEVHHEEKDALPEMVCGDSRKLHQVLLNLLDNAVKFTESGKVTMRSSVVQRPESEARNQASADKWRLRFDVEDTGVGIPSEIIDDIFKPFYQGEMEDKLVDGTGLGLTLSRSLVELMGGCLTVKSPLPKREIGGAGSIFTVELDFRPVDDEYASVEAAPGNIPKYQGGPKRLLIVDDNSTNLNLLVDVLAPLGFEITTAGNGREALDKAARIQPDLILLDLLMPVMDGLEVLQHIRRNEDMTQVKIIGVSAAVDDKEQMAAFTAACDDVIQKPVNIERLLIKIEEHLAIRFQP